MTEQLRDIGTPPIDDDSRGTVHVFIFDAEGLWTGIEMTILPSTLEANTPEGCVAVEDVENPATKRLVDGQLVDYIPPSPGKDYEWLAVQSRWVLTREASIRIRDNKEARDHIAAIERASLRALREWALGDANAIKKLKELDDLIAASREKLVNEKVVYSTGGTDAK